MTEASREVWERKGISMLDAREKSQKRQENNEALRLGLNGVLMELLVSSVPGAS